MIKAESTKTDIHITIEGTASDTPYPSCAEGRLLY